MDEHVRFFVAPPLSSILTCPVSRISSLCAGDSNILVPFDQLKPYVYNKIKPGLDRALFGRMGKGGFDGSHYLKLARSQESP